MIGKIFSMVIVAAVVMSGCNSAAKNTVKAKQPNGADSATIPAEQDIPYTIAKRYFVNSSYHDGDLINPKITTPGEFKKIFGMAPIMGPNGKPTAIDFSREYAVAVIGKLTDRNTSITINSVQQKDNLILLSYKVSEGEKESVTIRPLTMIIIDNKYQGDIKLVESH